MTMMALVGHWDLWRVFSGYWFGAAAGAWFVAAILKALVAALRRRKIDLGSMLTTGGMPSAHTATVCALAFAIGHTEGFATPVSALAATFAVVTMVDAATVRRAAGEQAKVINGIVSGLELQKPGPARRLKELLGHTVCEVFWGLVVGIVWAALLAVATNR